MTHVVGMNLASDTIEITNIHVSTDGGLFGFVKGIEDHKGNSKEVQLYTEGGKYLVMCPQQIEEDGSMVNIWIPQEDYDNATI